MATKSTKTKSASKSAAKSSPAKENDFNKDTYLTWFKQMLMMRRFEEKCGQLYTMQKFGGFCHLYIGQEAVLAGMKSAIGENDRVITAYRDHCHPLVMGTPAKHVMAELYGKTTGTSKGRGGSMHFFDKERNLFGGHGIVGGQIALGAGIAFADKYKKNDSVTLTFFGDGAARQGILHETFNMAMTWKLPVIFLIENNNYAMGTSVSRTSNVTEMHTMGESYDMPGVSVDGMSCEAVHKAISEACAHVRSGKGPILLDVKTYRYKGHSMSDPQKYRTKEEVASYKDQDPIETIRQTILDNKYASEKTLQTWDEEIKAEVLDAVKFAEESPEPAPEDIYEYIYSEPDYPFVKD